MKTIVQFFLAVWVGLATGVLLSIAIGVLTQ